MTNEPPVFKTPVTPSVKVNINVQVRVTLSPFGKTILAADDMAHMRIVRIKDVDQHECALWELMRIFGRHMHMGMTEMPFVGNVVEINRDA